MTFRGAVPQVVQQILAETVRGWNCNEIFVGCSGNFTIERALGSVGKWTLHGNDVTLYSGVIGAWLSDQPCRLEVKDENFSWLKPYTVNVLDRVATVMLSTQLVTGISTKGDQRSNEYYERMRQALLKQFPDLHQATVRKLENLKFRLASYHSGDVVDWIKTISPDKAVIAYPPFADVGAATQYARDTAKLELIFDWDKPSFTMLDGERRKEFLRVLMDRQHWAFGSNRALEGGEPYLRGMTKLTNRGTTVLLYHSDGPRRIVMPRQETEPVMCERLRPGMEIGQKMTLAILSYKQFQTLRSQYMNVGIRPGAATLAVGVLVDGYMVGVYAFSAAPRPGGGGDIGRIYMLSDFPVAPTDYPRLSKLVLYAALSSESKMLAERITKRRMREVLTTAYSNNPVSMKYRGLFKIHTRKDNPTKNRDWGATIDVEVNEYYARKYELNYLADIGTWSLAEGLETWKRKHGEKGIANESNND